MVLEEIKKIPYGEVITYNDIAKVVAKKKNMNKMSAQAVGGAVRWNLICLIIPCHRVIGTDGSLTGYGEEQRIKKLYQNMKKIIDKMGIFIYNTL